MAPRKKTHDEKKIADKIRKAARYQQMKADPLQAALMKQKEREKYKRKKEKGQIKLVSQMTSRERRAARKNMREYMKSYRQKKKQEADKATMPLDGSEEDGLRTHSIDRTDTIAPGWLQQERKFPRRIGKTPPKNQRSTN